MSDPRETGREIAERLRPYLASGGVVRSGGESTSAPLRETQRELAAAQAAFAASQADLTEALAERDWILAEASDEVRARFFALPRARSHQRPTPHLDAVKRERDDLAAEVERLVDLGSKTMRERDYLADRLVHSEGHRDAFRTQRDEAWTAMDLARAELASAQAELATVRQEVADRAEALLREQADNAKLRSRLAALTPDPAPTQPEE